MATVLIVEDNIVSQLQARKILMNFDCEVIVAANGAEGLAAFEQHHVDLVLMDCIMPVMDGWQATEAIREIEAEEERTPVPIIAVSSDFENREQCLASGMNAFITKPLTSEHVKDALTRWLLPAPLRQRAQEWLSHR